MKKHIAIITLLSLSLASCTINSDSIIKSKEYDNITDLIFSPDSNKIAFIGEKNGESIIIKDFKELGKGNSPLFSPDSKRFAYLISNYGINSLVIDGVEGKKYDFIDSTLFSTDTKLFTETKLFSPDSKSYAYIATDNGKKIIVKDGIESKNSSIQKITFSPDSKSFIQIYEKDGKNYMNINGKNYENFEDGPQFGPIYSLDGKSFAYTKLKNGESIIVKDGKEVGKGMYPVYSPDGKSFTYKKIVTNSDGHIETSLIKDGKDLGKGEHPTYSPDSKSFAYLAEKNGKMYIVNNGINGTKYDDIETFDYSSDSKSLIYIAINKTGGMIIYHKGKEINVKDINEIDKYRLKLDLGIDIIKKDGKEYTIQNDIKGFKYDNITNIIYPLDGKSFAYVGKNNGKSYIIKDGKELGEGFNPMYSPDGKSFAYIAEKEGKQYVIKIKSK